jgi:hypothetical protein
VFPSTLSRGSFTALSAHLTHDFGNKVASHRALSYEKEALLATFGY